MLKLKSLFLLVLILLLVIAAGCGFKRDATDETGRPVPVPIATALAAPEKAIEAQEYMNEVIEAENVEAQSTVDVFATWAASYDD